jgi:DNA polymerase III alpha subunit
LQAIRDVNTFDNIKDDFSDNYLKIHEEITKLDIENNIKIVSSCDVKITKNEGMIPKFPCLDNLDSFFLFKKIMYGGIKTYFWNSSSLYIC